jgi:hypothetical protein
VYGGIIISLTTYFIIVQVTGLKNYETGSGQFKTIGILVISAMSILVAMMFQGLLDVHAVLHNPFGNRENDIPHESLCAGLRKLAEGLRDTADACTLNFDGTWNRGGPPLPPLSAVGAAGARGAASGRVPAPAQKR